MVATKAADALYAAQTSAPMLIIVGLTAQPPLEVSASPSSLPLAGISTLSTAGGNGAGAVSYSVISGPCAITGTSVSGIGVGSCTITATKAASGSYAATTSAPLTITVGLSVQPPMTLTATPASVRIGGTSELNVSGGGGDLQRPQRPLRGVGIILDRGRSRCLQCLGHQGLRWGICLGDVSSAECDGRLSGPTAKADPHTVSMGAGADDAVDDRHRGLWPQAALRPLPLTVKRAPGCPFV